jgi:hypothetical protein
MMPDLSENCGLIDNIVSPRVKGWPGVPMCERHIIECGGAAFIASKIADLGEYARAFHHRSGNVDAKRRPIPVTATTE